MPITKLQDSSCSVARSMSLLGERWTLLIVREALAGTSRFETFRENLGLAANVLSERLGTLVDHGVMTRKDYQESGRRTRSEYFLTDAGRELHVVVGALQQWGDAHVPRTEGPSVTRRAESSASPVRVAFVDEAGSEVPESEVAIYDTETGLPLGRHSS